MLHLQLSERDVERLLAGDQPQGRPDLAEVARFVARLRALGEIEFPPPMNPRLLAELDAAEAERSADQLDELERRRHEERRRARDSKQRWRIVGAAAMVVSLGGVVAAAQAQGSDPSSGPDAVDVEPSDEPTTVPTTSPPHQPSEGTKVPPPTQPPPTEAPAPPAQDQPSSQDRGHGDASGRSNGEPESQPPDWSQCGPDPECWMSVWPQFVPGSDRP